MFVTLKYVLKCNCSYMCDFVIFYNENPNMFRYLCDHTLMQFDCPTVYRTPLILFRGVEALKSTHVVVSRIRKTVSTYWFTSNWSLEPSTWKFQLIRHRKLHIQGTAVMEKEIRKSVYSTNINIHNYIFSEL